MEKLLENWIFLSFSVAWDSQFNQNQEIIGLVASGLLKCMSWPHFCFPFVKLRVRCVQVTVITWKKLAKYVLALGFCR